MVFGGIARHFVGALVVAPPVVMIRFTGMCAGFVVGPIDSPRLPRATLFPMKTGANGYKADLQRDLKNLRYASKYLSAAISDSHEAFRIALHDLQSLQPPTD